MHKKIIDYMNNKWKEPKCPMCSKIQWSVPDTLFELRQYHRGGLDARGTPVIPIIPAVCEHCGYTLLINSIVAGLVTRENY